MKKNSLIELMRFTFASIILLFHAGSDAGILDNTYHLGGVEVSFFRCGYLGVEFFFVISGFLMARNVYDTLSNNIESDGLAKDTIAFLLKKVRSLFPIYLIACVLVSLYFFTIGKNSLFIIQRLPSLLLLQRSGIVDKEYVGLAWYISSMLLCMALLYPLLRKHYYMFCSVYGPLLGLLLIGFLIHTTGYLGGVSDWIGVTYKCNYRAFAELSLGAACYEASRNISQKRWTKWRKYMFSVFAILSVLISIGSTCSINRLFNDGCVLLCMCVAVTIVFGKVGLFSNTKALYNNKAFIYLGKLSMPMFLLQNVLHYWVSYFYKGSSITLRISLVFWGTVLLSVLALDLQKRLFVLSSAKNR